MSRRILLGQLGAYGDCLCATTLARQIKQDMPDCHLTWAIGSLYRGAILGNPHVDAIWELPLARRSQMRDAWRAFARQAAERKAAGEFDAVHLSQIYPDNYRNFDGTLRPSIFRAYPHPVTVPVQPVLRLEPMEVEKVADFARRHALAQMKHVLLWEAAAYSDQSFVDPAYALAAARLLVERVADVCVVISSSEPVQSGHERIVDGSALSLRENAELTRHCSLFVGCYSGISWAANSEWAKPLPQVQVLKRFASVFASSCHDAEYFGLPQERFLELQDCSAEHLAKCLEAACLSGYPAARAAYHQDVAVTFDFYFQSLRFFLLSSGRYAEAAESLAHAVRRYGRRPELLEFARRYLPGNAAESLL